jgi:hypothetical protein
MWLRPVILATQNYRFKDNLGKWFVRTYLDTQHKIELVEWLKV